MATDLGGIHARNSSNQATVGVTVKRNQRDPRFQNTPYSARIVAQNQQPGDTFFTVKATDGDDTVRASQIKLFDVIMNNDDNEDGDDDDDDF